MSTKHHEHPEKDEKIELGGQQPAPAGAVASSEGSQGSNPAPAEGGQTAAKPAPEAPQAELEALRERVAALEKQEATLKEENSSLKDQYLRKLADYENFRKRMFRERDDSLKFANAGLLTDLIPILDDFDRAVGSADHGQDFAVLHDGVGIIRRQLGQLLANKYGLESFDSVGQAFDPNIHEALASEPGDVPETMVSEVLLPGYRLHERVLRSAKVRVKTPAPQASPAARQPDAADASETAQKADDEAKR
jgi:molecular chaperone GrpE